MRQVLLDSYTKRVRKHKYEYSREEQLPERIKDAVRERHGGKCAICGKTEKENGRKLSVHHEDLEGGNWVLIPLCDSCHSTVHRDNNKHFPKLRLTETNLIETYPTKACMRKLIKMGELKHSLTELYPMDACIMELNKMGESEHASTETYPMLTKIVREGIGESEHSLTETDPTEARLTEVIRAFIGKSEHSPNSYK